MADVNSYEKINIVDDNGIQSTGEVQETPTQYTLLGRLKDIWDRLTSAKTNFFDKVSFDSDNLKVVTAPASAPPATTPVNIGGVVYPNKNGAYTDTYYTITNGKTLTLQNFSGGSEATDGKIELWYDPDGDMGINKELIEVVYMKDNFSFSLSNQYIGNGTKRIVLRSTNNTSTNGLEFANFFSGYEV